MSEGARSYNRQAVLDHRAQKRGIEGYERYRRILASPKSSSGDVDAALDALALDYSPHRTANIASSKTNEACACKLAEARRSRVDAAEFCRRSGYSRAPPSGIWRRWPHAGDVTGPSLRHHGTPEGGIRSGQEQEESSTALAVARPGFSQKHVRQPRDGSIAFGSQQFRPQQALTARAGTVMVSTRTVDPTATQPMMPRLHHWKKGDRHTRGRKSGRRMISQPMVTDTDGRTKRKG